MKTPTTEEIAAVAAGLDTIAAGLAGIVANLDALSARLAAQEAWSAAWQSQWAPPPPAPRQRPTSPLEPVVIVQGGRPSRGAKCATVGCTDPPIGTADHDGAPVCAACKRRMDGIKP